MNALVYFSMFSVVLLTAPTVQGESGANADRPACCSNNSTAESSRLTEKSIYQLETIFTNDIARPLQLRALRGRPQIVTMFFAHCSYACPLLVQHMKQIESRLPKNMLTNVGFVLVSFDSERDTPEALSNYRKQQELPAERWTLLHGEYEDVLELSALLGVKFKKDVNGDFMHSNVITLLNSQGEIAFQQTGLKFEPDELIKRLKTALVK
jgi:protein SCO1/2